MSLTPTLILTLARTLTLTLTLTLTRLVDAALTLTLTRTRNLTLALALTRLVDAALDQRADAPVPAEREGPLQGDRGGVGGDIGEIEVGALKRHG